ncbi:Hsp20/alpha crystallin family protein [Puia sp. P3]|uniref:Hsp20/alpha crystallin family protein n=1 Tax=Puia sp. P3 TaxID=3423952 RepID=UPI003D67A022
MTVAFEKHEEKTAGNEQKWLRREYRSGAFSRSFTVDRTVDVEKAAARYDNGILTLTLPKRRRKAQLPEDRRAITTRVPNNHGGTPNNYSGTPGNYTRTPGNYSIRRTSRVRLFSNLSTYGKHTGALECTLRGHPAIDHFAATLASALSW